MKTKLLICLASLLCWVASASTNITFWAMGTNSSTYTIPTNQVCKILSVGSADAGAPLLSVLYTNSLILVKSNDLLFSKPIIVGPAGLRIQCNPSGSAFCTVQLSANEEISQTPSGAVVIPADANGPVNIILESSVDLVTWTAALPGTYGASTEKRFFRVRAERAP